MHDGLGAEGATPARRSAAEEIATDGTTDRVEREAARVLVVDQADRLLLLQGEDPARPELGRWWFTPGGGLDPGESAPAGAARELAEETGLHVSDPALLGDPVWQRTAEFDFDGRRYRQSEVFFLLRVEAHAVDTAGFTDLERRAVRDHRWWTMPELEATTERVYPSVLALEVGRLLTEGRPAVVLEVAP